MSKRRTKEQIEREAPFAPGGPLDYGPYAGIGSDHAHLPERRVEAGIVRGREDEFVGFLQTQTDPATARLIAAAGERGFRTPAFRAALAAWVTERDRDGLIIPKCIDWHRKPA